MYDRYRLSRRKVRCIFVSRRIPPDSLFSWRGRGIRSGAINKGGRPPDISFGQPSAGILTGGRAKDCLEGCQAQPTQRLRSGLRCLRLLSAQDCTGNRARVLCQLVQPLSRRSLCQRLLSGIISLRLLSAWEMIRIFASVIAQTGCIAEALTGDGKRC